MRYSKQIAKQLAKQAVKKGIKLAGKALAGALGPLLIPILIACLLVILFLAGVYGAMPVGGYLSGVEASPEDEEIRRELVEVTSRQNVADYYIVPGETPGEGMTWYEEGGGNKVNGLYDEETGEVRWMDDHGRDARLANRWSDVYAVLFYDAAQKNLSEFPVEQIEPVARELRPYFYVKESKIIRRRCHENEEGEKVCDTDTDTVYLLVEAKTIRGWYQYRYEWVKEEGPEEGEWTKYERLKKVITIEPKWKWLEDYLVNFYRLEEKERALTRMLVTNASEAFSEQKEWFDWLMDDYGSAAWVSRAMIPADLLNFFKEAEKRYGIPWWFLAAVAYKESTFNPHAENQETGCYGLMQVSPDNWEAYAPGLGYDVKADRDNPEAQIMVGAYMLARQGLGDVDWEGESWKEDTLDALTFYGGFRGPAARERCREQYAGDIWEAAERFRDVKAGWPVQGEITSPFGWRIHPILRTKKFHNGVDIAAPEGTPVASVSAGIAETGYNSAAGNYVRVVDGVYAYLYCHLSSIAVSDGQEVQPGDVIGAVGSTGRSNGPHLHFGVKQIGGTWINPLDILP